MLLGISLGALLVCLCMLCNRRIERLAAPFVCGLMLLEYALAIWGRLEWLTWIAPACALCALAVLLVRAGEGARQNVKGRRGLRAHARPFVPLRRWRSCFMRAARGCS